MSRRRTEASRSIRNCDAQLDTPADASNPSCRNRCQSRLDSAEMADKKPENQFYTRPPKLGNWEAFSIFLWNSETKQFLGRTGASWAKILIFYLLFYAVLAGFFSAMLVVFYQTIDYKIPKWQLEKSIIGKSPGLGFRPMPPESNIDSTLIWYKSSDKGNVQHWQRELNKFLIQYNRSNNAHADKLEECRQFQTPAPGKVCNVRLDQQWHPCKEILEAEGKNQHQVVWVSCEGENVADKEHIGPVRYIPQKGFPSQYFPYTNQEGYLSPLVAVHFEKPKRGVLINIECKAWARNIVHDRVDRRGSVHFELMID
ncbi:hypothetical protein HUJ05_005604 [Dendroctonus ponderosae]|nr:hypothetical protein HUJ05_005604 [Dendroctonus ponderosae]KAH1004835.1 hypothetical protein HUJ05_005604 [Dendroctonus ponderosae]